MTDFGDQLAASEILKVPAKMRPFLQRSRTGGIMQSWGAFAYGFSAAFDELYEVAARAYPGRDYLLPPVAYLARHSIELALKEAIGFLAPYSGMAPVVEGHGLSALWEHMLDHVRACGFPTDDEWTAHCRKLVQHFNDFDRGAVRFRYPSDQSGTLYRPTEIDLEGLGRAQYHLTRYCDAAVSMVDAASDPYG